MTSSSNYTILRLTSQSQANASLALRIPIKTTAKTVIKMTPEQLKAIQLSSKLLSTSATSRNTSPRIVEKTCGPFNSTAFTFESNVELENLIEQSPTNSTECNEFDFQSQHLETKNIENMNLADIVHQPIENNRPEEQFELVLPMTPQTEKELFSFLRSQSINNHEPPTAAIMTESELNEFGFALSDVPSDVYDLEQQLQASSSSTDLDHVYTNKRRRESDDSFYMTDDSSYPPSATSETTKRRRRVKGIYRQSDITNEEERMNYLERRKKNNLSSKNSRANKKNYYSSLDGKCFELSKENDMLEHKISILEYVNKFMKEHLIQRVSAK